MAPKPKGLPPTKPVTVRMDEDTEAQLRMLRERMEASQRFGDEVTLGRALNYAVSSVSAVELPREARTKP